MKKPKTSTTIFLFLCALLFINGIAQAQSVKRQVVSSMGPPVHNQSNIKFTVGQPYATNVYETTEFSFRPGFQQAVSKKEKVSKISIPFSANVFPNPAHNSFSINHNSTVEIVEVKVHDLSGNLIYEENGENVTTIKSDNWNEGIYMVIMINKAGNLSTTKINIQH
ncbi:T9SS type A sorting domain-containing protein [Marivirga sp.]|uniref:T9SS type A sorting domain-containing protein n=1 Tax=Marivirga sp. TaxID=2018662 RepID=UPI0025F891DF|nr:T9SS type A sorting domain-containing protein [Marivirga sp.]